MHNSEAQEPSIYGLMAEFKDGHSLTRAAVKTREAGYRRIDAFSPLPVHGLAEALDFNDPWVPWIIFISGLAGGAGGYLLQWWVNVVAYPLNVGGRPYHSWPNFIPPTFECTVLFAAFGAVIGMLALNGLPRPHHPVFNAPRFELASQDRFFLCIEAADKRFDRGATEEFLRSLEPQSVSEVEN